MSTARQLKKSEQCGVAVKTRYFTPAEAQIPPQTSSKVAHYPIAVNQPPNLSAKATASILGQAQGEAEGNGSKSELDGFLLLEAAGQGFPEDVEQANLADRRLRTVVEEDLTFFSQLLFIDVSENRLPFSSFGALPKLRELRMACNFISFIEDDLYGFNQLLYLDLSYNSISSDSVLSLAAIPLLKELDLSGNQLQTFPPDLSRFQMLDKLILQHNKLESHEMFFAFATLPSLRSLDVSHNYFSRIPNEIAQDGNLRLLDTLDISFNYFSREENIQPLIYLPRLTTVMLYGNPLLGPTGEDPLFVYIEDTIDQAHAVRDSTGSIIPDIEFITEVPRRRLLKKGQPLGRLALYRDFSIVQVDGNISTKNNKEWRKQGTQTLFAESIANRRQMLSQALQQSNQNAPQDFTFLTSVGPTQNSHRTMGDAATEAIADEVMRNVADQMGLLNPLDIQILEEHAKLPPSLLALELEKALNQPILKRDDNFMGDLNPADSDEKNNDEEDEDEYLPQDRVPSHLFSATIAEQGVPATIAGQPIALKTAMKALQRAIEQPLTNYDEVPAKWSNAKNDCKRPTTISQIRQLPRILRPTPPVELETSNRVDSKTRKYASAGLAESNAYKHIRKQNREKTLEQIDRVLERLNENTHKMTSADLTGHSANNIPENATTTETEEEPDEKLFFNANAYSNPYAKEGLMNTSNFQVNVQKTQAQQSTTAMKQSIDRMRYFARPAGVKQLKHMVDDIVEEFNS